MTEDGEPQGVAADEEPSLVVFAREADAPSLGDLLSSLTRAAYPASIGSDIAGDATDEELASTEWDTAVIRWQEPELHEAWLVTRYLPGVDEEALAAIAAGMKRTVNHPDEAGRLIVLDHLRRTAAVYVVDIQPPMLEDDDHRGWDALDVLLRALAMASDGLIYAESDGFFDAEGEIILDEDDAAEAAAEDI